MLTLKLEGMAKIEAQLRGIEKQVTYATMVSLNRAAYTGAQAAKAAMVKAFDRPTPLVLGSVRYKKATRQLLQAQIDLDFWGNKQGVSVDQVLRAQIHGGQRKHKRHEVALQRAGILPAGMAIVPGAAAQLDQFGNMKAGQIVQIMSWFQSFGQQGYSANMKDGGKRLGRDNKRTGQKGFSYFALQAKRGKLLPGIYQRFQFGQGSAIKPVMIFVRLPAYRARFDFYGVAKTAAEAEFHRQFKPVLAEAIRTAR